MMASTASGHLLRSQVIVPGKTTQSVPPADKLQLFAKELKYSFSDGHKHWSNLEMMKEVHTISFTPGTLVHLACFADKSLQWITDIVLPYINDTKRNLGLWSNVWAIFLIDCWSVHRSKEFLLWMKEQHGKTIQIHFVPANCECTSLI